VVKNLQSACFGGTNFHLENDIEPRIKTGQIKIHNRYGHLRWMHLKVFLKLKKKPKTLSSRQKNPQKTQKTQKTPKNPLGCFFFKTRVFSNPVGRDSKSKTTPLQSG
jgi:uncharacterized protein YjhX (UPF0386 family)